jgi:hypothetical protein
MAKSAKKKPAPKKKLTLKKSSVRKLAGGKRGGKGQRPQDSYMTCNMKCNSDPSACGCG